MRFDPNATRRGRTHAVPSQTGSTEQRTLSDDDEKMIVLQSRYQRMSAERIGRHHRIPVGQVRRILARRTAVG